MHIQHITQQHNSVLGLQLCYRTLRTWDTSDLRKTSRHFGPKMLGPKCPRSEVSGYRLAACVLWRLQTISCCRACSLSSWTSTSVRVSWPSNWYSSNVLRYEVSCTTRPGCGSTKVSRKSHAVIIKTLEAGTYHEFRVTNVKRYRSYDRYCAGTTSLYSLRITFHL